MQTTIPNHHSLAKLLAGAALVMLLPALTGLCATSPVYPSVIKADGALAYYRFNDSLTKTLINVNNGSLGPAGNATNDLAFVTGGHVYSMPGAIVGDPDRATYFDYTARSEIPFNSAFNTPNTQPFTVESWIYPVSDQGNPGMGVWCNRWTMTGNRQGWVMYQRAANTNSGAISTGPGLGWEFRMYNDLDTSTHLDVQSLVPFTLGKWQHVAVVYDPVGGDPTNAILSIYIDGVFANAVTNNPVTGIPGYGPCTGDHATAPNGQPMMSVGGYNNANSGTFGFMNPWIGGIDEFAWYSNKLSAAQILAHYQNGTNAARSTPYDLLVKSANPVVYLRLDEVAPAPDTAFNIGDARSAGHATNTPALRHPSRSALAGRTEDGSHSANLRGIGASGPPFADIPYTAGNNPDASVPFTVELWARPTSDDVGNGPCPINNRIASGLGTIDAPDRTGWVIYQRNPNATYDGSPGSGEHAVGWTLRVYHGQSHGGNDVVTGAVTGSIQPDAFGYVLGQWTHLVFTWEPQTDNGTTPSGSEQWLGILTAYTNGVAAATNPSVPYAANLADNSVGSNVGANPADFCVGMYNLASQGSGQEPFEGDIDEVAFYNGYVLTPAQVLAHYQAGTNAHPATNYETLVFNAAGDGYLDANPGLTIPERTTIPTTYLRFNEPAYFPAANSGALGALANGSLVLTTNIAAGPTSPSFPDFESPNPSVPANGSNSWVSLNDPSGLNFSGQITLEAWIKPDSTQGPTARIVSRGPPTPTHFDPSIYSFTLSGSLLSSNEVFLRIDGGTNYTVGTSDGTTFHGATAAITAGDIGGANGWIYLVGAYDGSHWNLFRNGIQIATSADAQGALPVSGAEWAIGATGMGWGDFFSGTIDEVAIYDPPLNPSAVWAHYYIAQHGRFTLNITRPGGVTTVSWPAGTLQQADSLSGPWSDVGVALPPAPTTYNPPGGPTKKFYRVKL